MQAVPSPRGTARLAVLAFVLTFVFGAVSAARADSSPPAAQAANVQGWWVDQTGKAGILIAPCGGGQLCGRIEWLRQPLNAAGQPKTDIHNPDASLRARPDCGLPLLGGFTQDSDGSWHGGWVYDPDSGNTYKSNMHVGDDGRLHVRGYIGISLLGRTEIMTRPAAPLPTCSPPG